VGAGDGESFPIRRPLKLGDIFRGEVRDLMSGRAVKGLHKNVIHALITNNVRHRFPVGSEGHGVGEGSAGDGEARIGLNQAGGRLRICVKANQCQLAHDSL